MRIFGVLFLSIFLFGSVSAQSQRRPLPTPTPDGDIVKVATEEIKVNALAFDEDGKFAPDLKAEDIVITDNNILHVPTSVRRIPASVLIVMDTGGEMRYVKTIDQTRKVAVAVVNSLRAGDSIAVIEYSDKAEIVSEWSTDKNVSIAAIGKTKFGKRSALADAIELAKQMLTRGDVENRHLVLITDGTDSVATAKEKSDAVNSLLSTDINVHVISYAHLEAKDIAPRAGRLSKNPPPKAVPDVVAIGIQNSAGRSKDPVSNKVSPTINIDQKMLNKVRARKADLEQSEAVMAKIAENTNGEIIIPETLDEMIEKAKLVSRLIDASYVVTYTPKFPLEDARPGSERTITVTSKNPSIIIQSLRKLVVQKQEN